MFHSSGVLENLGLAAGIASLSCLITVYRPGSQAVSSVLIYELADLLERCPSYSQCLIVGDFNIHLDSASTASYQQFKSLLDDCGMADCVNQPTHRHQHNHLMYSSLVATSHIPPQPYAVCSFIDRCKYNYKSTPSARPKIFQRKWRSLNVDDFAEDLLSSDLILSPPVDDAIMLFSIATMKD